MAIISQIGRKSLKIRILIATIYIVLIAGAVTMVYPFLLMIAGSTKSSVDAPDPEVIPMFLRNDTALYRKHTEGLVNEHLAMMRNIYNTDTPSFRTLDPPSFPNTALVGEWETFLRETDLPHYAYTIGYAETRTSVNAIPYNLRSFKKGMSKRFDGDIGRLNREMDTEFVSWNTFRVVRENYLQRRSKVLRTPFYLAFYDFKARRPVDERYYFTIDGFFKNEFLKSQYTKEIETYNQEHGTACASWDEVHLDRRMPAGPGRTDREREDWEEFTRTLVNLLWIRAEASAAPAYRRFLMAKYNDIGGFNRNYGTGYISADEIPFPEICPEKGLAMSDWEAFLQGWKDPKDSTVHKLPVEAIRVHSVDFMFRDFLQSKYGTTQNANTALGTSFVDWMSVLPPQQDWHYLAFCGKTGELKWEFAVRNFAAVIDYVVLHGRAVFNTVVYCGLSILCALLINPLAAYALSRYKPPSAYKVLLFLMLTMAFPPMVTQIPAFLMLREFHLLNTYWALILPGVANGYSIFLLKGFFDSLPQELYESAEIDGAGEFRIFWQITMSLSKPILAVIALQTFTATYGNFMMALLYCPKEKMWTLMPWLYQLQMDSCEGVVFASLLVAAIPTLLIFMFCQNIIMRGIVVPVEK